MKTAIQQAIEELQERRAEKMAEFDRASDYFVIQGRILAKCFEIDQTIKKLQSLLPTEQQIIEDAYNSGHVAKSSSKDITPACGTAATDYFTKTFLTNGE